MKKYLLIILAAMLGSYGLQAQYSVSFEIDGKTTDFKELKMKVQKIDTPLAVVCSDSSIVSAKLNNDSKTQELEDGTNKTSSNQFPDWIVYVLIGLISCLVVILFFVMSMSQKRRKQLVNFENEKKNQQEQIINLTQLRENNEKKIRQVEQERDMYKNEIVRLKGPSNGNVRQIPTYIQPPSRSQPVSLFAKSIVDGRFNRVKEQADEETIFELKLSNATDLNAKVAVYSGNEKLVISHPEFLDGCTVTNLGRTTVTMTREGEAQKESDGKWLITVKPEIRIS